MNEIFDTITRTKEQKELVTIYTVNGFGSISMSIGTLIELGKQVYAQYNNAPYIKYTRIARPTVVGIPKGKRKEVGYIKGYKPFLVVLKGFNHPEPNSMFNKAIKQPSGLITSKSTYSSFDERYITDFNEGFNSYLEANKDLILMDVRS